MSLFSAFLLWSMVEAHTQSTLKKVGDIAEDFELTDVISGDSIRLHDYRGSIVLLDFFFIGEAFAEITQRSLSERFRSITMNAVAIHMAFLFIS